MFKPAQPSFYQSDVNNRFLKDPNSGLQFGSNGETYSGGVTGKAGQTFANPRDESSYWDNDPVYQQMISKMQSMPVGVGRDALRQQIEDYRSNKFNVQALPSTPAAVKPTAPPIAPAAPKMTVPGSPRSQRDNWNEDPNFNAAASMPPSPAAAASASTTPAASPAAKDAIPSPCDGLMDDIDKANKMRIGLESEMGASHVNGQYKAPSDQHHSMMGFVNKMLINAHKRMTDCIAMNEKQRSAPIEKERKIRMAEMIKKDNESKAFHSKAKAYGQDQANDVAQKAGALLSMGKISPEQYQTMTADPSMHADTVNRMHAQNFAPDAGLPSEGSNETIGYQR